MTFPTIEELAGIVMLAFITVAMLVFPSYGRAPRATEKPGRAEMLTSAFSIDGIETTPLLSERTR